MPLVISSETQNHIAHGWNIHQHSCKGCQSRPAPSLRILRQYPATVLDTTDCHSSYASNKRNFDTKQLSQSQGFNRITVRINNEHVGLNVMVVGHGIETTGRDLLYPHRQLHSCFQSHCVSH